MFNSFNTHREILRRQVWGLAALVAAIALSWMAYTFYQPKILKELQFVELAGWLGILQGLLCAIIEPLSGKISDGIQQRLGSRLPMISFGVMLAGLIFIIVSLLTEHNLPIGSRWIIPVLMTVWVIATIIFRGPAIALLTQFAPTTELPQANAILVLVVATVAAIEPLLNTLLYSMGASIAFIVGAIALMLGAYILQSFTPKHSFNPAIRNQDLASAPSVILMLIFVIGLAIGFEINLLFSIFPQKLQAQLPGLNVEFIASEILLVAAIASVPLGDWITDLGANKSMLLGLGSITGLMGLTVLNDNDIFAIILILAFGVSFSLVFISMIPLVFAKIPANQAGLGTGLYFGSSAGGTAIASLVIKQIGLTSVGAFLLAEVAFLIVTICIFLSKKIALR
ncbi:MFS transporter [Nostoc sp. FACHB-110]|uniref:MFS transporter n=1 Tax=Nostoc sp. FACHB-110 TaxID=2692834 RepID=UPI001688536E|nr:MFS transporter [Nostoc sp. FACHB-110]MBD2439875.1 MFS transporter [Nostoc sp. FACHB-110]